MAAFRSNLKPPIGFDQCDEFGPSFSKFTSSDRVLHNAAFAAAMRFHFEYFHDDLVGQRPEILRDQDYFFVFGYCR